MVAWRGPRIEWIWCGHTWLCIAERISACGCACQAKWWSIARLEGRLGLAHRVRFRPCRGGAEHVCRAALDRRLFHVCVGIHTDALCYVRACPCVVGVTYQQRGKAVLWVTRRSSSFPFAGTHAPAHDILIKSPASDTSHKPPGKRCKVHFRTFFWDFMALRIWPRLRLAILYVHVHAASWHYALHTGCLLIEHWLTWSENPRHLAFH